MQKYLKITLSLLASMAVSANAAIVLNTGDAWSSAIPADFNNLNHGIEFTSTEILQEGVTITLTSTGGVLEHFLDAFGVGTEATANDGELSSGETLTFSFDEAVTLTHFDANFWDAGGQYSYTVAGSTYNDTGDGTKLSQTTDSFTAITFNAVGGNGGFSNLTFEVVPEPSSYALIGGCFALSAVMLRRRRV